MASQRSFRVTLLTFFILLVFHPYHTLAGFTPTSLQNITTEPSPIDLHLMYNGNGLLDPQPSLIIWHYHDAEGEIGPAFSTFNTSLELMAGSAEDAGNDVVDIVGLHLTGTNTNYWYPASLALGLYHLRINSTVNTTTDHTVINNFSARSETINVTSSMPIGCGSSVPAAYDHVTSPSSPNFSSLYIIHPSAGQNIWIDDIGPKNLTEISWFYRDTLNTRGAGISNVTAQILDSTTSAPVGPLQKASPSALGDSDIGSITVDFADVPMQLGGTYKVLFSYQNNIQDGPVSPGNVVSFTTQEFNVVVFEDFQTDCANITSPADSGKSKPESSSSGTSGDGGPPGIFSGASRVLLPGVQYLSILIITLASILLVI